VGLWAVDTVLEFASNKATENRRVFSGIGNSLFGGDPDIIADRDRAFLQQMLRQIIRDISADLQNCILVTASAYDTDDAVIKELSKDRSAQIFEFLTSARLLSDNGIIEESIMRLCKFFVEQPLRRGEYVGDLISSKAGIFDLCELLGVPENSHTGSLLIKREAAGFACEDGFNNPLLCLNEIAPDVKDQLIWYIAAALRHLILEQSEIASSVVDNCLEEAAFQVIASTDKERNSSPAAIARSLHKEGYLDLASLSAIFRRGDFGLFEAAIVQLTEIDIRLVRRLIFEAGGVGFAVLAIDIGLSLDDAVHIHNVAVTASHRFFPESVLKSSEFQEVFSNISVEDAKEICGHWKRAGKFQNAIWEVNTAGNLLALEG
jgi:hypothetical protein